MKGRNKALLGSFMSFIVIAVAIAAILFDQISKNFKRIMNLTDDQARVMLNNELPKGAGKSRVVQFLDAKKWPYGDNASIIQTMIHDAEHNGLIRTDIQIRFSFDSEERN
jgi:hypothetical protein